MTDIITKDELVKILEKMTHDLYMSIERGGFDSDKIRGQIANKIISKINEKIGHRWIDCDDFKAILLDTGFEFGVLKKISNDKYMLEIEYPKNKF